MKKFNLVIFLISVIVIGVLTFVSFLAAFAIDEGNKLNMIWLFFSKLFYVLRFPTHTLFWAFLTRHEGPTIYLMGLFINCIFYALLIERIFSLFNKRSKTSSVPPRI
jgi:hypothetical protein